MKFKFDFQWLHDNRKLKKEGHGWISLATDELRSTSWLSEGTDQDWWIRERQVSLKSWGRVFWGWFARTLIQHMEILPFCSFVSYLATP